MEDGKSKGNRTKTYSLPVSRGTLLDIRDIQWSSAIGLKHELTEKNKRALEIIPGIHEGLIHNHSYPSPLHTVNRKVPTYQPQSTGPPSYLQLAKTSFPSAHSRRRASKETESDGARSAWMKELSTPGDAKRISTTCNLLP